MTRYTIYLETAADGRCIAHAPALPGCIVRAPNRDEAVQRLPDAIRDHHAWLRRHGEPSPAGEAAIVFDIAGESAGCGPFDQGGVAALLPPDRQPVSAGEVESHLRLAAHARADLLALVRDLPDDLLDWQPAPHSFSIRDLLRHVGNAEEWYVSRLVAAETLPPEWAHDEDLSIFEFLEMERRTAAARLRQLTEAERSEVFYPTAWTDHPEEPWTARKALRRFLEHEREHTAQARDILAARRCHLLARLAAGRAEWLAQLLGLDEPALIKEPVAGDWTIKALLAHVAAWDRWEEQTMRCLAAGGAPDLAAVRDMDAANAAAVAAWAGRSLVEALAELQAARSDWLAWLETSSHETFFRPRPVERWDWAFPNCLEIHWQHDAQHAAQVAAWREATQPEVGVGPKSILLAALAAGRDELLAAAALTPPDERAWRPVCGEWSLQDVLGHVADWEWLGVEGLRHMAAGRPPKVEFVSDEDAWNQTHVEARRGQPWAVVWADLQAAREALLAVLQDMSQADLARTFPFPWGGQGTPYRWLCVYVTHDREHAHGLRESSGVEEATP